jgi:chromosome segregation ATPase
MVETLDEYCKRTEQEKRELLRDISRLECEAYNREKAIVGLNCDKAILGNELKNVWEDRDRFKERNGILETECIRQGAVIGDLNSQLSSIIGVRNKELAELDQAIRALYDVIEVQRNAISAQKMTIDIQSALLRKDYGLKDTDTASRMNNLAQWRALQKTCDTCRFYPAIKELGCPIECMMCREKSLWEPISK